ncbi:MAG: TetR family transcriptional regulator [Olsenella sp.]|nr:TetR family transcriptional regulator [Olsenella sp.]
MADYIRARSPERKRERMDAIMRAADALFARRPYHQITMGTIAEELGWSRSNLYKYAATQEEIFLALHTAKNRAWLEELVCDLGGTSDDGAMRRGAPDGTTGGVTLPTREFARVWAEVTERHASFLRYQEILTSVIESNVTLERLTEFKRDFAEMLPPIREVLARQCGIDDAAAQDLYLRLLYQAPGLWNHYHCAELAREAMSAAGLPEPAGSFTEAYADFVETCVEDAQARGGAPESDA